MAEGRRSSRAHKAVNYAKLDYGSDEDDDFKPAEAPPSKRPKPSVKEAPKKPEKKPKSDTAGATESSSANQKQKAGRASLDDKLFQRDLEAALRISQNGSSPHADAREAGGPERNPEETAAEQSDMATFPDHLELAGEVVVQSEPSKNAEESAPHGDKEEDYEPEQEDSSEEEGDPSGDDSDEDSDVSDDDEEFAPTRASRKKPAPKKSPVAKKTPGPAKAAVSKAPTPPVVPVTTTKASTPARAKAKPSTPSVVSPAVKSSPRPAAAAKSSPRISSGPLPQRTTPSGSVPMTVPKFSTGHLPASGIRLGLSRRSFSKPLHSAVKVQQ